MFYIGMFLGLCGGFLVGWCACALLCFGRMHQNRPCCPIYGDSEFASCPACEDYIY